jgi:hypothetical protein
MSSPRRFEQVSIVVGSVLMLAVPMSVLTVFPDSSPYRLDALIMYGPGLVVGVFVALDILPVSYGQVWLFGVISWPMTILLWGVLEVGSVWENPSTALGAWVVAWAKPKIRWRGSEA